MNAFLHALIIVIVWILISVLTMGLIQFFIWLPSPWGAISAFVFIVFLVFWSILSGNAHSSMG